MTSIPRLQKIKKAEYKRESIRAKTLQSMRPVKYLGLKDTIVVNLKTGVVSLNQSFSRSVLKGDEAVKYTKSFSHVTAAVL